IEGFEGVNFIAKLYGGRLFGVGEEAVVLLLVDEVLLELEEVRWEEHVRAKGREEPRPITSPSMAPPPPRPARALAPFRSHPLNSFPNTSQTPNPAVPPPREHRTKSLQLVDVPYRFPCMRLSDSVTLAPPKRIKTYPQPPSTKKKYPFAIQSINDDHIFTTLDPTGARTRLFSRTNPDTPRVGDILLCTFTTGDPFSGVCLNIRHRGPDTSILLRNRVLTVGVEMWVKIYSPKVRSIEVVERAVKRARRARLYYMRKPKHDRGSVEGVVEEYLKRRRLVRSGAVGVSDPSKIAKNPSSARKGVGAR
ncbi:MAG: hypothetical protein Q9213_003659, partial [Squamulea squamosa]